MEKHEVAVKVNMDPEVWKYAKSVFVIIALMCRVPLWSVSALIIQDKSKAQKKEEMKKQ